MRIIMDNKLKIMPNENGGIDVFINGKKIDDVINYTVSESNGNKTATLTIAVSKIEIES